MPREFKSVLEDGPIEGEPLVSVCVITYNHGKYIRQCLDGILMQKVNFPYEILIHDDASPDDTADIIREYWEKYPTVIKPILREENQYSKGVDVSRFNFNRAKAKYIAHCEGDDYWTDAGKLQMQVDFLEEHGEYIACVHRVNIINEIGEFCNHVVPSFSEIKEGLFNIDVYNTERSLAGHLSSLVMCNIYLTLDPKVLESYYLCKANGDEKLSLLLLLVGKQIWCFENVMSVYRRIVLYGTSYNAQIYGKNIYYDNYKKSKNLHVFAKTYFNEDISTLFCEKNLVFSIVACIKQPNSINFRVTSKVFNTWLSDFLDAPIKHICFIFRAIRSPQHFLLLFREFVRLI